MQSAQRVMKRVVLYLNGSKEDGRVVAVTHSATLNDLLISASSKLGVNAAKLYTRHGGLIDDVHLVRDDDVLYVSEGESFISFEQKTEENDSPRRFHSLSRETTRNPFGVKQRGVGAVSSTNDTVGQTRVDVSTTTTGRAVIERPDPRQTEPNGDKTGGGDCQDPNCSELSSSMQEFGLSSRTLLPGDWITINVGGKLFTTTRSTLTNKEPNSMLARMFAAGEMLL